MTGKLNVGILYGGKSTEHEISLLSAQNVLNAINRDKYDITLIGIDQEGQWYLAEGDTVAIHSDTTKAISLALGCQSRALALCEPTHNKQIINKVDVIFPVLHGGHGEDGSLQGLLRLMNIPFVGAGVLGSAIGMDKDVMKRLLRDAQIPISKFKTFSRYERDHISFEEVKEALGMPLFVKPANTGSSVGISKVRTEAEFDAAIALAFKFDHKIVIEEFVAGREIECAVLGNGNPMVSIPGEIKPHHEFYSYEAKYLDDEGATLSIPADVSPETVEQLQKYAKEVFKTLCCSGMARVDFFLCADGRIFVNEINTIPGFTSISMYPSLWAATGIEYSQLIERLIDLALEQHQEEGLLDTRFLLE